MVPVSVFVKEMRKHWEELGHVSSNALESSWKQLAESFLDHVKAHEDPNKDGHWTVLSLPTGTGKTEGSILYSAMLSQVLRESPSLHPGILIVTRMIKDADRIAAEVNRHSERYASDLAATGNIAVAFHSESSDGLQRWDLHNYPVLVITHKAYENALDGLESRRSPTNWDHLHGYLNRKRKLVIIDESIDVILECQMGSDDVRRLLGLIPGLLYEGFRDDVQWLKILRNYFDEIPASGNNRPVADRVLLTMSMVARAYSAPEGCELFPPMLEDLREALYEYRDPVAPFPNDKDPDSEDHARRGLDDLIRSANALLRNSWVWQTKNQGNLTLNTARLLVPEDVKGAVVLDAMADTNVFYEVFPLANRLPRIPGTRRYDNVNLHVSKGNATGKITMKKNAKDAIPHLVYELEGIAKDRKTVVISHLSMEGKIRKAARHLTPEKGYTLGFTHWGAINGSNDWREFDTAVLFGLHHLPLTWPINVFFACRGVQSNEWLSSAGNRPFGKHGDIKQALKIGQLTADVVQAINRIRCREVVDADGNCLKSDIYLLIPKGATGEAILEGIEASMPGIRVVDWGYCGKKASSRKERYLDELIDFLREMEPGEVPLSAFRDKQQIPQSTLERLQKKLRGPSLDEPIGRTMAKYGVRYVVKPDGRTRRAYLAKEALAGPLQTLT